MNMFKTLLYYLWRGINYSELWAEELFAEFGIYLPVFFSALVLLSAGYRFILGPYLKGTGYFFGDFKAQNTYNGGNNKK